MIVLVAVAVTAAIDQHAMIEQCAVTLGHALQSLQQVGQLRDVECRVRYRGQKRTSAGSRTRRFLNGHGERASKGNTSRR